MSKRDLIRRLVSWLAFSAVFFILWYEGRFTEHWWPSALWFALPVGASIFIFWAMGKWDEKGGE